MRSEKNQMVHRESKLRIFKYKKQIMSSYKKVTRIINSKQYIKQ